MCKRSGRVQKERTCENPSLCKRSGRVKIQACAKGTELCKTKLVQMGVEGWGVGVEGVGGGC